MMPPHVRDAWLRDCRDRVIRAGGSDDDSRCASALDDYLRSDGYASSGYGAYGCCQPAPMMMIPVVMQRRGDPECTETVEYEELAAPARPAIRRAPKRAPDKRIRIN